MAILDFVSFIQRLGSANDSAKTDGARNWLNVLPMCNDTDTSYAHCSTLSCFDTLWIQLLIFLRKVCVGCVGLAVGLHFAECIYIWKHWTDFLRSKFFQLSGPVVVQVTAICPFAPYLLTPMGQNIRNLVPMESEFPLIKELCRISLFEVLWNCLDL